jgi:hypothetical protein
LPDRGNTHERLGDRRQEIAGQRHGFSLLQPVREGAGEALHDVLCGLGKAIHEAHDAPAGVKRLRQKDRQDRVKHLGGDVGKEARKREQKSAFR